MDFTARKGADAFGTRLRRLSERLDRDVAKLYADADAHFEPRWFPVVTLLAEEEPLSVTQIAATLGLSHPAVSQVVSQLTKEGLIKATPDQNDERRRLLTLTAKAHSLRQDLEPLWQAIGVATKELIDEEAAGLLTLLGELDKALDKKSLGDRVHEHLDKDNTKKEKTL